MNFPLTLQILESFGLPISLGFCPCLRGIVIDGQNVRLGIALMLIATLVFATQDGLSRYLAEKYSVT